MPSPISAYHACPILNLKNPQSSASALWRTLNVISILSFTIPPHKETPMAPSPAKLKTLFGLNALPFDSDLKAGQYFLYPQFEQALSRLKYVAERHGIATLIAPPGTGKSTLIRAFIDELGKTLFLPAYVPESTCSTTELYKAIALAFDIVPSFFKVLLIRQIKDRLLSLAHSRKITPVLILDEAHLLHRPFFDELRILTNFDADCSNPIMLLLAGQPTLHSSLRLGINESFSQRIIARLKLSSLDRSLSEAYIIHRLKLAGRTAPLFSPDAIEAIYAWSNGVFRLIDRLSETSLLFAFKAKKKDIDLDIVNLAIEDLDS
jgi:type II secretory pathway predicted ATPase ExeA